MSGDDVRRQAFRRTPGTTGKNDSADPTQPVVVPSTPGSVGGSAEGASADQLVLQKSLDKVNRMIEGGRRAGLVHAARHLEHWRRGTGQELIMPASAFEKQEFVTRWLKKKVWPEFTKGVEKRLKSKQLGPGGKVSLYWIDSLYAPQLTDLFFALGGFTIRSDVVVRAVAVPPAEGGGTVFEFERWVCQAFDTYNWDLLKSTYIPGIGRVEDEELRVLEAHGYGKMFSIKSDPWTVTDPQVLQAFSVTGY